MVSIRSGLYLPPRKTFSQMMVLISGGTLSRRHGSVGAAALSWASLKASMWATEAAMDLGSARSLSNLLRMGYGGGGDIAAIAG
jgi:hypothetical protein